MIPASTQRLLSFLSDTASYPHHPTKVRMVQTHASWVFIASPFVYKFKKPVNLGFLDFSTPELRRADCKRELALNRRLADDIYLGLETIRERGGSFHFGGDGEIVEWAVKMREMEPRWFLKRLMKEGAVGTREMDRVIEKLLSFYTTQPPLPESAVQTASEHLEKCTEDNFAASKGFVGQSLSQQALDAIASFTREFFSRHGKLLSSRIQDGWIRDCHGDLHLDHIHLSPDAVRIYDCIEFNTDFRYIDVACDIAFLAMDLDFNDRPDLARYIVEQFGWKLHDEGMARLMDFYKCYRACVRGKVESLHSKAETAPETERKTSLQLARRYYQHALHYAIAGSSPRVFVFMGKVASGKSALAEALGRETGWPVLSSDRLRKTYDGTPLTHRGSAEELEALYSPEMNRRTYDLLFEHAFDCLHSGHTVILDATFSKRADRDELKKRLKAEGSEAIWIEASASVPVIRKRLLERDGDEEVISDARLEDYKRLSAGYEPPDEMQVSEKIMITTDGTVAEALHALMRDLAVRRASSNAS